MFVVGTAGHVDHGKSTLVEALTGIDPDRLREEKEREMTIDLGFAWVTLPNGETVGVIDVPGHRDFIENMLAGVGGIDAALFVIAADEGVMPQTEEHLAILDLLEIQTGVVALTKIDLVDDPEWLDLVTLDISEALEGTVLESAPIIPVSARTGEGIDKLAQALADCLAGQPARVDKGLPRLPIDRVFTLSGFGTIVTGTLTDGSLSLGETVEIQPGELTSRIRGLQTHRLKIERATPGSRVAVNLTGLAKDDLARGQVVTTPGWLKPTVLVDVEYRHLATVEQPLRHNVEVKFFSGAAEILARTRVLGQEFIAPGQHGWLQLRLAEPVAVVKGDHFILRRPSPGQTLGGGVVVDPAPRRRHRRFRQEVIERLETLAEGTPEEILLHTLQTRGPLTTAKLAQQSELSPAETNKLVAELIEQGQIMPLGGQGAGQLLIAGSRWDDLLREATNQVAAYHRNNPLKEGMMREELKSRLKLAPKEFNGFMERAAEAGALVDEGIIVRLPSHEVRLSPQQQSSVDRLLGQFHRDPFSTPSYKDAAEAVGEEVLGVLINRGELVQVSPDVLFLVETVAHAESQVRRFVGQHGSITVAQARDLFQSSRKYVLALLEYFDRRGITRREGDVRVMAD
jgi:selenocysteine-specific elongation factor